MSDEIIETLLDVFEQYMAEHDDLTEEQKFRLMDDLQKSADVSVLESIYSIFFSKFIFCINMGINIRNNF